MVPKNHIQEQKDNRKSICSYIMERLTDKSSIDSLKHPHISNNKNGANGQVKIEGSADHVFSRELMGI